MTEYVCYTAGATPADVLKAAFTEPYPMELIGEDRELMIEIVNQGIDAHLEAFTESEFDDKYNSEEIKYKVSGPRLHCKVGPKDMLVLLRRLWEVWEKDPGGSDESKGDAALSLRQAILGTVDIEEV